MICFFGLHILFCLGLVRWYIHLKNTDLNSSPWRPCPRYLGSTLSTQTCVEEGDLALDTSSFKHTLPCTTQFHSPDPTPTSPFPAPLPSPFSVYVWWDVPSHFPTLGRPWTGGKESRGITHTQGRRQWTEVSLLLSSCCHFSHDSVISRGDGWEVHLSPQCCNSQLTFTCGCSGWASNFPLASPLSATSVLP